MITCVVRVELCKPARHLRPLIAPPRTQPSRTVITDDNSDPRLHVMKRYIFVRQRIANGRERTAAALVRTKTTTSRECIYGRRRVLLELRTGRLRSALSVGVRIVRHSFASALLATRSPEFVCVHRNSIRRKTENLTFFLHCCVRYIGLL